MMGKYIATLIFYGGLGLYFACLCIYCFGSIRFIFVDVESRGFVYFLIVFAGAGLYCLGYNIYQILKELW